jgi:hypothetical protein
MNDPRADHRVSSGHGPSQETILVFYLTPGPVTGLGIHAPLAAALPADIAGIRDVVQGLLLHVFWAERYGVRLTDERKAEVNLRRVDRQLARLLELDPSPLPRARPVERRLVGNCRDFSTLMAGLLRARGIPARARCGFGTYFRPERYEDHWTCECWDADAGRWRLVDAQLDAFQRETLRVDFDPLDVPRNRFLCGGAAWLACRSGSADPERFGIHDLHGLWFVRGDLVRDFMALNKVELLPWDHGWGHLGGEDEATYPLMDRIARLAEAPDESFEEIRSLFAADTGFSPPAGLLG